MRDQPANNNLPTPPSQANIPRPLLPPLPIPGPRNRVSPKIACSSRRNQSLTPLSQSLSVLPVTKFNHLWTIKNFSFIPSDTEFICCPNFSPPNSKDKWFMKLRPKTVDDQSGIEYIGIHLFLRSCEDRSKQQVRAKYVISVLDAENDPRYTGECSRSEGRIFKAGTEGHGYKLLAPRDLLINPANNMLGPEDSLRILCEITMFGDVSSALLPNKEETDLYSLEELQRDTIAQDFTKMIANNPSSYDVTLIGKDGVQIKAHKLVLAARSKPIEAMFEHETKEKMESKIEIADIDGAVLEQMVNFIYTDKVNNLDEFAGDLILAAEKYDLPRLKRICEQYLFTTINVDNASYVLALSDLCNSPKLREKALEFIVNNPSKIIQTETWNRQLSKRPLILKEAFEMLAKKPRPL